MGVNDFDLILRLMGVHKIKLIFFKFYWISAFQRILDDQNRTKTRFCVFIQTLYANPKNDPPLPIENSQWRGQKKLHILKYRTEATFCPI